MCGGKILRCSANVNGSRTASPQRNSVKMQGLLRVWKDDRPVIGRGPSTVILNVFDSEVR